MAKDDESKTQDEPKPTEPKGLTDDQARALAARIRKEASWARDPKGRIERGLEVLGFDAASAAKGAAVRVESARGVSLFTDVGQFEAWLAANKK